MVRKHSVDEDSSYQGWHRNVLPGHVVTIVDVVSGVAERLKTGDHRRLEIRLVRNSEQDKCDE